MKKILFSISAVLVISMQAEAGGNVEELPPVPSTPVVTSPTFTDNWSGAYIGIQGGYIQGEGDIVLNKKLNNTKNTYKTTLKPKGGIGGVYVGYNKLLENDWVTGVELALNYTNIKKSGKVGNNDFTLKQKGDVALYGKVGKIVDNDKTLLAYLLGGVSGTTLEGGLKVSGVTLWNNDTVYGLTVGGGIEYMINQDWNMRLQYRFSKYSDANLDYYNSTPNGVESYDLKVKDYKTHSIMLGVSRHF